MTWRHLATGGLLLVALPVFGIAALACLPVLLVAAAGQGLWRVWRLARQAAPVCSVTLTPSH